MYRVAIYFVGWRLEEELDSLLGTMAVATVSLVNWTFGHVTGPLKALSLIEFQEAAV